ncbi:hypothetical protein LTR10_022969 [Elasticomyces elasticus]|nr:hypothetical protein LTR10_022969 [Elasticomyces elasticus]
MQSDQKKRGCSAESQLHRIVEGQKAQLQQAEVAQADQQTRFSSLKGKVDELVELIARKMTYFTTQTVDHGTTRSDLMRNLAVEIEESLLLPPALWTTKRKPKRTLAGMQGTSDCGQGDRPPVNKERGFSHNHSGEGDQEREDLLDKISQSIERLYLTAIPTPAEQQFSNSRDIRGGILDILNHVLQSTVYEARLHHYYSNDQARAATVNAELSRTMALLQTTSHLELKNDVFLCFGNGVSERADTAELLHRS